MMKDVMKCHPAVARPAAGDIVRVRVAQHQRRPHPMQAAEIVDHLREHIEAARRGEIPEVRGHNHPVTHRQRHGVLEIGSERQRGRLDRLPQPQFDGRVATAQPEGPECSANVAEYRIIRRAANGPVVMHEGIGHAGQPRRDAGHLRQHRFAAQVRRGGNQRSAEIREQQMMQRRIGQHQPDLVEPGRNRRCQRKAR